MTHRFKMIKSQRLSDDAVDQIVNLIRSNQLEPGERLPSERDLRDRLGVSRASVREAVRVLETMGILRVAAGRGTYVRDDLVRGKMRLEDGWLQTHYTDVLDLLEMRETLEVKAAALAAERGSKEQAEAIHAELDEVAEAIINNDIAEMIVADAKFHDLVARASGNSILIDVLESLEELAIDTRRVVAKLPGRLDRALAEHRAVADAISAHDPEGAGKAMFLHVRQVQNELLATLSRSPLLEDTQGSGPAIDDQSTTEKSTEVKGEGL